MPKGVLRYPAARTPLTQAERIIIKFNGHKNLHALLKAVGKPVDLSAIYRWTYAKNRGEAAGIIPAKIWPALYECARLEGIMFTIQDLDVRPQPYFIHQDADVAREAHQEVVLKILDQRKKREAKR